MVLALPHLIVALVQSLFYLLYSAIPVYAMVRFGVVERVFGKDNINNLTDIDDPNSWKEYFKKSSVVIIINYSVLWGILILLQFSSLRRFS
jgi:hypothetical protein